MSLLQGNDFFRLIGIVRLAGVGLCRTAHIFYKSKIAIKKTCFWLFDFY